MHCVSLEIGRCSPKQSTTGSELLSDIVRYNDPPSPKCPGTQRSSLSLSFVNISTLGLQEKAAAAMGLFSMENMVLVVWSLPRQEILEKPS